MVGDVGAARTSWVYLPSARIYGAVCAQHRHPLVKFHEPCPGIDPVWMKEHGGIGLVWNSTRPHRGPGLPPHHHPLHTSAGAAAPGCLLTLHILQLDDFDLRSPPLTAYIQRHMRVIKKPRASFRVVLVAGTKPPSGLPAGPRHRAGWVHSHCHRC